MKYFNLTLFFICLFVFVVNSQSGSTKRPDVIETIESTSKIKVKQDSKLDRLINDYISKEKEPIGPYSGAGYRVQVFSSNAQRTAKDESLRIERQLRSAFPGYGVYRTYSSPFWKVRIGDFRTHDDAQNFRNELTKTFPELRKETYTVRESRVNIR
ncbi:MAG: SPOR domain-containing protein [Paludibacteraceae bacterium]